MRVAVPLLLFGFSVVHVSCTPHAPVRLQRGDGVVKPEITSIHALQQSEQHREVVRTTSREHHDAHGFKLAIVEFDDRGRAWHPTKQLDDAIALARETFKSPNGGFVVAYAHGWKHGASVCDDDLACFRELLAFLRWRELTDPTLRGRPRQVAGVYLGWRGLSTDKAVLKEFTFWNRKAIAQRVGRGDAAKLLSRLSAAHEEARKQQPRDRLVAVGHSFGAALMFAAAQAAGDRPVALFGDTTVLLNPAFEAQQYKRVHRALADQPSSSYVRLLTVGSRGDLATRIFFPIGRLITAPFRPSTYRGPISANTALANYRPFITHRLVGNGEPNPVRPAMACSCRSRILEHLQARLLAAQARVVSPLSSDPCVPPLNDVKLLPYNEKTKQFCRAPFEIARAEKDVIRDHGEIFSRSFTQFLYAFLDHEDKAALAAAGERLP